MRDKNPTPKKRKSNGKIHYFVNNMRTSCHKSTFRNLKKLQNSTHMLIPKLPFSLLVREIFMEFKDGYRIQRLALQALQESAEWYLVDLFNDANRCCAHAKRVTLFPNDMRLVLDLRGCRDPGFLS